MLTDEQYMRRCLQLARLGAGSVAPNPMVGAVLVHQDKIIGEGYHQKYGGPHAEVNCFNSVAVNDRPLIEESTIYVSLEPCSHHGKTPPCADLIIKNKVKKTVIGCTDSYEEVSGRGIRKMQEAGIEVVTRVLEDECLELNQRFFTFHREKRPYIILKWAQSADSKISAASKERTLISNEVTNRLVHKWRSEEAGILVGTHTALADNPALTTRLWKGGNPTRIVIDKELALPPTLKLFNTEAKTFVFNHIKDACEENIEFIRIDNSDFLEGIIESNFKKKIQSVLVEGGAKTLQTFIDKGLWDEARVITNEDLIIGAGIAAPMISKFNLINREQYLNDRVDYYSRIK